MSRFTVAEARAAAERAGFSPAQSAVAAAIAMAESGGESAALSPPNRNGTRDHGAWQINSVHASILASGDWRDLNDNARMAKRVYDMQGFRAWTVFNTGGYRRHLSAAESAASSQVSKLSASPVGPVVTPAASTNPLASVGDALGALATLPQTLDKWGSSFAIVLGAAFLVAVGLALIFRREASGVVKTAVDVAT